MTATKRASISAQLKSNWWNSPLFLRRKHELALKIPQCNRRYSWQLLKIWQEVLWHVHILQYGSKGVNISSFEGLFEYKTPKPTVTGIWHFSFHSGSAGPTFNFRERKFSESSVIKSANCGIVAPLLNFPPTRLQYHAVVFFFYRKTLCNLCNFATN